MFKTADGITVYTRQDWGARPPREDYSGLGELRSAVVHHGGPVGGPRWTREKAAQTARSWQDFHMDVHGWDDIGYHFLVDARGRIYLGRPVTALGAHVLNQNSHRVGINFMQDGRFFGLTFLQKRTFRKLLARSHHRLGLPALVALARHPGADYAVLGHREVPGQATECPGRLIEADYKALLKDVMA